MEKGNLKLAESIFNATEVSNGIICSNHNEFSKSYKVAVSFNLNSADFPRLPFPSVSKPVSSVSASLPFISACKPFPRNISIRLSKLFAIPTSTPSSGVFRILQGDFFPKLKCNPSKPSIPGLVCNIPTKHNHRSICKFVQAFEPVVVNLNFVSVPVCHFYVVESIFHHQHVSSLTKPNVKYVSS